MWQLVVSKLYSRSVGGAGEVELLDRRHLRALKVSCGWWRAGHVTPVLASPLIGPRVQALFVIIPVLGFTYVLTLAGPSHQVFQVSCSMWLNVGATICLWCTIPWCRVSALPC